MGRFRSFVFSFFLLLILVFLSGCVGLSKFDPVVEINEDGSGQIHIEVSSLSEADTQISNIVGERKDLKIEKSKENSFYYYEITFSFDDIKEISEKASFQVTDHFDRKVFRYSDLISARTITGREEAFIDFKYCIITPGYIKKFRVDNITDTTFDGKRMACAKIKGDKDNVGQSILLISEKMKEGCLYKNPPCRPNEECIDNVCVTKVLDDEEKFFFTVAVLLVLVFFGIFSVAFLIAIKKINERYST